MNPSNFKLAVLQLNVVNVDDSKPTIKIVGLLPSCNFYLPLGKFSAFRLRFYPAEHS